MAHEDALSPDPKSDTPPKKRKHRRWGKILLALLLALILAVACFRPFMPRVVRWYVNRTLDRSLLYHGKIGDVDIHLWRGAYSIQDVRLVKMTGNVPVPLFAAQRVDFAVQWNALLHGKVVGRFALLRPQLNFVAAADDTESQSGAGGPWLQIIQDLFPFDINSARITDGSIHFRTYQTPTPVDVYLDHLDATVDNLTNIRDSVTPLLTSVDATAQAMDQAPFEFHMKLDPFSYRPTFHLTTRLIGLDVTKINALSLAYGNFDFKRGFFDLVVEVDAKHGLMAGYVKPLFRDLTIFSLSKDIKQDDPLQFFWTALVGGVAELLTNQPRDQFGTLIPFTADATGANPDILATVGNVLYNAFIRAYLPKLQPGSPADAVYGLQFQPPDITSPAAAGQDAQ